MAGAGGTRLATHMAVGRTQTRCPPPPSSDCLLSRVSRDGRRGANSSGTGGAVPRLLAVPCRYRSASAGKFKPMPLRPTAPILFCLLTQGQRNAGGLKKRRAELAAARAVLALAGGTGRPAGRMRRDVRLAAFNFRLARPASGGQESLSPPRPVVLPPLVGHRAFGFASSPSHLLLHSLWLPQLFCLCSKPE